MIFLVIFLAAWDCGIVECFRHGSVDVELVHDVAMKAISSPDSKVVQKMKQLRFYLVRPLFLAFAIYILMRGMFDELVGFFWAKEV